MKIRASQLGKIMTSSKTKGEVSKEGDIGHISGWDITIFI